MSIAGADRTLVPRSATPSAVLISTDSPRVIAQADAYARADVHSVLRLLTHPVEVGHRTDNCVRTAMLVLLACQALHSAMAHAFERRARGAVEGRGGGRAAEAEAKEPGLSGGGGSGGARRARRFA